MRMDDETYEALRLKMVPMTMDERIEFCLALGDEEIRTYAEANGITEEEARRRKRVERQLARPHPSKCKM